MKLALPVEQCCAPAFYSAKRNLKHSQHMSEDHQKGWNEQSLVAVSRTSSFIYKIQNYWGRFIRLGSLCWYPREILFSLSISTQMPANKVKEYFVRRHCQNSADFFSISRKAGARIFFFFFSWWRGTRLICYLEKESWQHLAHDDWGQSFVRDMNCLLKSPGSLHNKGEQICFQMNLFQPPHQGIK